MTTRENLIYHIVRAVRETDLDTTDLKSRLNDAITRIAAGILLPDGKITPPLPDLASSGNVTTSTTLSYAGLPATYQRNVYLVADANDNQIFPPEGGTYYDYAEFLAQASKKDLSQTGSIYMCAVKGSNLYYQARPLTAQTLLAYFYRLPVDMTTDTGTTGVPDGIPEPFHIPVLVNMIAAEYFGEQIGEKLINDPNIKHQDKGYSKYKYFEARMYEALINMSIFIGWDEPNTIPQYFDGRE